MYTTTIGLIAAALTTIAFLPQAIKTFRLKSTDDLSPAMFFMLFTGVLFWLLYGIITNDLPIILANSLTICFSAPILYYIFKKNDSIKIDHIAIWVQDLEKMKDFYCYHLESKASARYYNKQTGFSSYFISFNSKARIELMHNKNNKSCANNGHISISVGSKEKVDEKTTYFKQQGFKIESAPRTTGDGYYESVIRDPEGNFIEITL